MASPPPNKIIPTLGLTTLLLTLFCGVGQSRADEPPYPVWWSPLLELERLEDIDARLARALWPGDPEGMPLIRTEDGDIKEVSADNCIELEELSDADYYGAGSSAIGLQFSLLSYCRAIEMLRRAQPAATSYLRGYSLDESVIHTLPAMVYLVPSCDFMCRQWVANDRRIPLVRFEPVIRVTVESPERLRIQTIDWVSIVTMLGRGDFNGDGVDDLLVLVNGGSISGTWRGAKVYLLTRDAPDAVLTVLEEGRVWCGDYQCDPAYDYPRVLGETDSGPVARTQDPAQRPPITFDVIGGEEYPDGFIAARKGPPFAVWWWPLMGVESLADIDELLAWDNWLTPEDTLLEIESAGQLVEVPAKSCLSLLKLLERGYQLTAESRSHVRVVRDCRALQLLGAARPAKVSHLREFTLDAETLGLLSVLPEAWRTAESARDQGALVLDERTLQISGPSSIVELRFVAGGDFTGDSLDDVLVVWDDHSDIKSGLFILSRDDPRGSLRVVAADTFSPPNGCSVDGRETMAP